jgi:hypothetical protein
VKRASAGVTAPLAQLLPRLRSEGVRDRLRGLLDQTDPETPLMQAIAAAAVASNRYDPAVLPELRIRMTLMRATGWGGRQRASAGPRPPAIWLRPSSWPVRLPGSAVSCRPLAPARRPRRSAPSWVPNVFNGTNLILAVATAVLVGRRRGDTV